MPNTWEKLAKSGNVTECACGAQLVVEWPYVKQSERGVLVDWRCPECDASGQFALDLAAVYELHDGEYEEVANVRRVKPKRPTGWTRARFDVSRRERINAGGELATVMAPTEGVVKGPLGVAKPLNAGWGITHIPTGMALGGNAGTQSRACEAADRILALPGMTDILTRWTPDAAPPEWATYEHRELVRKILWSMSNGGAWPTMPEGVTV